MVKSCIFVYTIMCISYNAKNFLQLNFPHPCWFLGSPISSQLSRSIILISTLESRESFSSASAIAPDTSGVDMDVPLFMLYRFPAPGVHAMICRPGATRSGLHTHSNVGPRPDTAREHITGSHRNDLFAASRCRHAPRLRSLISCRRDHHQAFIP